MSSREDPLNFYIVVNKDAGMQKGKIAAHVGHATHKWCDSVWRWRSSDKVKDLYEEWDYNGAPKITLIASKAEFDELKKYDPICVIRDAGHTQIERGTETVLAFRPMYKSKRPKLLAELKLL